MFLFDATSLDDWRDWFSGHGEGLAAVASRVALIVVLLLVFDFIFRRLLGRVFVRAMMNAAATRRGDAVLLKRRADTLLATLNWAFGIFLLFLGTGLVLSELGMNVSALIAGVGVVGIALGLGAQTLVKDVLNGMFILLEDQYAVGDQVTVGGATGEVIEINPRRTVLRDADGNIHSIPNSAITTAVNRTPGQGRVRVEVEAPFREADRAAELAAEAAAETARAQASRIVHGPSVVSTVASGEGEVTITLVADARPGMRWTVEADLRRRLEERLAGADVEARLNGAAPPA